MQTQLYTSIVYQIRHSSLVINSFYLMFNRLMTSIIGLETRSFFFFFTIEAAMADGGRRRSKKIHHRVPM